MAPTGTTTEQILKKLQSYNLFYGTFNNGLDDCSDKGAKAEQLRAALNGNFSQCQKIIDDAKKIAGAYCSACFMNSTQYYKNEPCYFFYYWLGELFFKHRSKEDLDNFLEIVYRTMRNVPDSKKCNIKYKDENKHIFEQKRKVHIFSSDYGTIQRLVGNCKPTDCSEYLKYLQDIKAACKLVSVGCDGSGHESGEYCNDYNEKYKNYCDKNLQELIDLCIERKQRKPNPNPNQAGSSGSFSDSEEDDLDDFPSKLGYSRFNGQVKYTVENIPECNEETVKANLNNALDKYASIKEDIDKIAKAWCYTVKGRAGEELNNDLYYLFYYWLGGIVWKKGESNTFPVVMNAIYSALWGVLHKISATPMCTNIDQGKFNQMKKVFNYYYDYSTITECIESSPASGPNCTDKYSDYLDKADAAYGGMEKYCGPGNNLNRTCCTYFKKISNQSDGNSILKPLELKSKLEPLRRERSLELGPLPTADGATSSGGATPAIISSTAALIGLPMAAFFLYKVISTI
ncbi:KIR protein [Plasmodium coatneyi]|uniref:KIR protein n=1 Tax=Plasmodium coatneyi TaxID=208452 RepID=A0A1B1E817_9APIC|nr:KIR protein [Plasmodium coatneyi]ANQ11151.1 KIR protein [Plasmodium coatneyi]